MKNYLNLFTIIILLTANNVFAQELNNLCGTITNDKAIANAKKYARQIAKQSTTNQTNRFYQNSIPIQIHVINDSNGLNGIDTESLNQSINEVNAFYNQILVDFYTCGDVNYINNSLYHDLNTSNEIELIDNYNVDGLINIYFVNSLTTTSGNSFCGKAYFPGSYDTIFINNTCALNGSSLIHEIGHFFSLIHTHGNSYNLTDELVDGSNCNSSGDFICDTPADPRLSYTNVNPSCTYTGNQTDANGDIFNPLTNNIMSYSRKPCRNSLTPMQLSQMHHVILNVRNNFSCSNLNADFSTNDKRIQCESNVTIDFTDNSINATSWQWDVNGDNIIDYTTQNPSHTYTESGLYNVTLTVSNGNTSVSKIKYNYIVIGANNYLAENINLDSINAIQEIGWESLNENNSNYKWIINVGGTPSPNTGPTGDNSSNSSGQYIYTEASYASQGDVATLISPCTTIYNEGTELSFSYHMFGSDIGELHVDIDRGEGFVNDIITPMIGQQQQSQDQAFMTANINLSSYINETIRIRIRAIRGNNWASDIAIDDISFTPNSLSVNTYKKNDISLYPNPVKDNTIFLKYNNNLADINYKLYSTSGQELSKGFVNNKKINVQKLNPGVYFIVLESEGNKISKKIIKL